jgi:hypothetical protein
MSQQNGVRVVHRSPGRLRVRIAALREDPDLVGRVREQFTTFPGVTRVETTPETGSLLVSYEPAEFSEERFAATARDTGLFDLSPPLPEPAIQGQPRPRGARGAAVYAGWERANRWVEQVTGGVFDLRVLVPLALVVWAVRQILVERPAVRTPWYTLLWYAFGLFTRFNPEPKPAERSTEPGVGQGPGALLVSERP